LPPGLFDDYRQLAGIGLALALGLLVGLQRGWAQRSQAEGSRFAGIRTFGLFGLAGGVAGHLSQAYEQLATIILATSAGLILLAYYRATRRDGSISGTASVVALLTLASGFLAGVGERQVATVIAVTMVLLLALRSRLHALLKRISEVEVLAVARFAVIAAVILPLLPDRAYGPFDAWNPRQLWLVVVLVSGFSFAGYIAARLLGASRGLIATAAAGSMVSSTAVTASLATRLKAGDQNVVAIDAAIAAASAVMFLRVMVLTGVLAPFALPWLARLAVPGLLVSLAAALLLLWRAPEATGDDRPEVAVRNPFTVGPALLLMGLVMVMSLAARWVLARFGNAGLASVLALSGTVDVDSAIITMGGLPTGTLEPNIAGLVLLPPIALNSLFKAGTLLTIAGWRRGWRGAVVLAFSAAAAVAGIPLVL